MRHLRRTNLIFGALVVFFSGALGSSGASVLTYHNDNVASGVNASETMLTPSNVTVSTFSKRLTITVDGQVYAQPLYVPGVVVTGGPQAGTHNLAIVATEHDSLYAIDADSGTVVWQTSFLSSGLPNATAITSVPAADTGTTLTTPEIGVCGTPVIDGSTNPPLLYVEAKTKQIVNGDTTNPNYVHTLYKIDITNGNAAPNANIVSSTNFADTIYNGSAYTFRTATDPTAAQDPFVFGTGSGNITVNGQKRVYFNGLRHMNRPGLLLYNGTVYVAFGSHGDVQPYHGWLIGFNKNTLAINSVLNLTPNGGLGGIWSSGGAPVVDENGYIYVLTGNGTFDGNNSGGVVTGLNTQTLLPANGDYGDSFVKMAADATTSQGSQNINGWGLKVVDYFAPFNNQTLSSNDSDLGSGGCTILPDSAAGGGYQHLMVGAGKQGNIYLINRDSMGKYSTDDSAAVQSQVAIGASFNTPAFFNGVLYYFGLSDYGKAFAVANSSMSTTPVKTSDTSSTFGSTPSVSANGTTNGIVWVLTYSKNLLRAYSANALGTELWTSAQAAGSRDAVGTVEKFTTPTVADGHVLVGTASALVIYGLSSVAPLITSSAPPATATAGVAYSFNYNATGFPIPTFTVTGGSLPSGLALTTAGVLSGTPNAPGAYSGTVTAGNSVNPAATQGFNITVLNTYNFWATTQEGLTGANALQTAIVSPDGLSNVLKYALGLNPFTTYNPGSSGLPLVQAKNISGTNYLTLTFSGVATDVTYKVQATSDLANWSTIYTSTTGIAPGTITVQDTEAITVPPGPKRFLKLVVTSP